MPPPYQYAPLESSQHIRLIHLKPGVQEDPVICEIHHVSLADSPVYNALSYTWDVDGPIGEPPQYQEIACSNCQLSVAPNLFSALRHLRKVDEDLVLWVDAVCINQKDNQERGSQVQIMHRIYSKCYTVQVWLGEASSTDYAAFDLSKKLWKYFSRLEAGSRHPGFDVWEACRTGVLPSLDSSEWDSIASLLGKRWFYRVWVVQEVAMGSLINVRCGIRDIGWGVLEELVEGLLVSGLASLLQLRTARQGLHMVFTISNIKKRVETDFMFTTMDVFSTTRLFNATDSRDKFYGLMGVMENEATLVKPNYDSPAHELFTERAVYSLINERTFACLSFADPKTVTRTHTFLGSELALPVRATLSILEW